MHIKDKLQQLNVFLFKDIWIFLRYLILMPLKSVLYFFNKTYMKTDRLNYPKFWVGTSVFFCAVFFVMDMKTATKWCLALAVVSLVLYEWDKGDWRHDWREERNKQLIGGEQR